MKKDWQYQVLAEQVELSYTAMGVWDGITILEKSLAISLKS